MRSPSSATTASTSISSRASSRWPPRSRRARWRCRCTTAWMPMTTSTSSMLSTSSNEPAGNERAGSLSTAQRQTADAFALKWSKRDTFDSPESRARARAWLVERYGDVAEAEWWDDYGDAPFVLDAGCGAGFAALELLGPRLDRIRYLGVDASRAVEVARARFAESGHAAAFLRSDITSLPLPAASVDVI